MPCWCLVFFLQIHFFFLLGLNLTLWSVFCVFVVFVLSWKWYLGSLTLELLTWNIRRNFLSVLWRETALLFFIFVCFQCSFHFLTLNAITDEYSVKNKKKNVNVERAQAGTPGAHHESTEKLYISTLPHVNDVNDPLPPNTPMTRNVRISVAAWGCGTSSHILRQDGRSALETTTALVVVIYLFYCYIWLLPTAWSPLHNQIYGMESQHWTKSLCAASDAATSDIMVIVMSWMQYKL